MTTVDEFVSGRLPAADLVAVSDVAGALNVSADKVRAWIDDGSVAALNIGTARKPLYRVLRMSVVDLVSRRQAGALEAIGRKGR
jgi:hypothetical protein